MLQQQQPTVSLNSTIKELSADNIHLAHGAIYAIVANLKAFAEAVAVLSKFSEQLLLHPTANGLTMTAFNTCKSAYAKLVFPESFFESCDVPDEVLGAETNQYCRISMKSALAIFKAGHGLNSRFTLELDPQADVMVIHVLQPFEINKCWVVPLRETTMVCNNVFVEKDKLQNKLSVQAKTLLNTLSGLDFNEAMIIATERRFTIERYVLLEDYAKVRKTEVTFPVRSFDTYHLHKPSKIVVNLRELKAVLSFAVSCNMSVSLHFDRPGRPLIVAVEENIDFSAEFVLATFPLVVDDESQRPLVVDDVSLLPPLVVDDESQRPLVVDEESQRPLVVDDESQRPLVVDDESQRPLVMEEESQRPLVMEEESQRPRSPTPPPQRRRITSENERFQRMMLSMSQQTINADDYLADQEVICYDSEDEIEML